MLHIIYFGRPSTFGEGDSFLSNYVILKTNYYARKHINSKTLHSKRSQNLNSVSNCFELL